LLQRHSPLVRRRLLLLASELPANFLEMLEAVVVQVQALVLCSMGKLRAVLLDLKRSSLQRILHPLFLH
jgi:hypothetical protein